MLKPSMKLQGIINAQVEERKKETKELTGINLPDSLIEHEILWAMVAELEGKVNHLSNCLAYNNEGLEEAI